MGKTKDELLADAKAAGVTGVDKNTTNKDIEAAIAAAGGDSPGGTGASGTGVDPEAADAVKDGVNAASRIVDADPDEKPGPASVMSKEIRPDERGEAARGESAFAAPAED